MSLTESRPNVLILMSDQHSKHYLGCYGNDLVRTPNLDRLWKLYHYHDDRPPVLYNLDEDPGEDRDLALDPHYEAVVEDLMARLAIGWDPSAILQASAHQDQDLRLLESWGAVTQLIHEDQVLIPHLEDVTLV